MLRSNDTLELSLKLGASSIYEFYGILKHLFFCNQSLDSEGQTKVVQGQSNGCEYGWYWMKSHKLDHQELHNYLELFNYVANGNILTSMIVQDVGRYSVFNNIFCAGAKFRSMKQELVLEPKRGESRTQWLLEVQFNVCPKTPSNQYCELTLQLMHWVIEPNGVYFGWIYSFNTSSGWIRTSNQFDYAGAWLLGSLDVIGECWETSSTSVGSVEQPEDRIGWDRSVRPSA